MDIHVDTEFTSLSDPRLIAIGAVAGESRSFYGIVSDFPRRACTRFVIEHVLPVLDANPADATLPHDALAHAFCDWLAGLAASGNRSCRLFVDDECDFGAKRSNHDIRTIDVLWRYAVDDRCYPCRISPTSRLIDVEDVEKIK